MENSKWVVKESRERMGFAGPEALTNEELISIVLGKPVRMETLTDLAVKNMTELVMDGFSRIEANKILAAFEVSKRLWKEKKEKEKIESSETAAGYLMAMKLLDHEEMRVLYLDTRNQLIAEENLFSGGLDSCAVDNRIILRKALAYKAAGIIVAHNHPTGNSEPSAEDIKFTRHLQDACKALDIILNDHIIIAGNSYRSLREQGIVSTTHRLEPKTPEAGACKSPD